MSDGQHRCPDCDAVMHPADPVSAMDRERLKLRTKDRKEGLLGSLGVRETVNVAGYVCPECGLVRLYADVDQE